DLGPDVKDMERMSTGEYVGRREGEGVRLFSDDGRPLWKSQWPGSLIATSTTNDVYGHTFGWIAGIDRKTAQVVWDDRTEIEPVLVGANALVLRGDTVKLIDPNGRTLWA